MYAEQRLCIIIPAMNEAAAIGSVLSNLPSWVDEIIVADNGSSDDTAQIAASHGARVVFEPRRGYGAACLRALSALGKSDIVVFLDADNSDDPADLPSLLDPIVKNEAELVIGSRTLGQAEKGALTPPQRFGNLLASALIRRIWQQPCTDLGPFRAIRRDALEALLMDDLDYGWTVQMQARALKIGLRVVERPVRYRKRIGRSKISGTLRGVIGAGVKILGTIARERLGRELSPYHRRTVLLFSRYPEPGKSKTRLIPRLGAEGAARVQREMTSHLLAMLIRWKNRPGKTYVVHYTGSSEESMRACFDAEHRYTPQIEGTLGERMLHAFVDALPRRESGAAVAIGADCPAIDEALLDRAFEYLKTHDVVLGPAHDGGYYLIGMRRPIPELFQNVLWGTDHVLHQTRAILDGHAISHELLDALPDVDEPEDLPAWEHVRQATEASENRPSLSIIIPTLNEADALAETLSVLPHDPDLEVIVSDGGSEDDTAQIARAHDAIYIKAPRGRARQMNAAAETARGHLLLFLHADSRLPYAFREHLRQGFDETRHSAAAFRLAFDDTRWSMRLVETLANLRATPYGDQALVMTATRFRSMGGFPDLPIMEDVAFVTRLRHEGPIARLSGAVITSARRYTHNGVWRTVLLHNVIRIGWRLGIPEATLARLRSRR